jgi:cobalt transporter subunit CbtA
MGHEHAVNAFAPEDGWERNLFTLGADILTGVGFAMMMVAGFVFFGREIDARRGLLWGLAGFAAFTLAPSLGLPPELPGTEAAPLLARQVWWLLTALATIIGIIAFFKVRRPWGWALGLVLFVVPHVVGAPLPTEHGASAPDELQRAFAWVAIGSGLLFWLALGCVAGHAFRRIAGDLAVR